MILSCIFTLILIPAGHDWREAGWYAGPAAREECHAAAAARNAQVQRTRGVISDSYVCRAFHCGEWEAG